MKKISKKEIRHHNKASERYVDVLFCYENTHPYDTSIPLEYRRTGTDIADEEIDSYLAEVYDQVEPRVWREWKMEQKIFWEGKPGAGITRAFFEELAKDFTWCCVSCTLPQNPNWARRIQDIKEFGYTLATNTKRPCKTCKKKTTQIILVPLKRGGITGYETWTPELRSRIVFLLGLFDAFEAKKTKKEGLLPDHKFPEIRWDAATKRASLSGITDDEIRKDFQLLSNQRNQQKREVCRRCFQSGERGMVYGIPFFYEGTGAWDSSIPKTGKAAEKGCIGCGWYDINTWRNHLIKRLNG
jgi:hypothetical protein